jgi:hypothetical protein
VKKSTPAISVASTLPMRPRAYKAQASSNRISSGVNRSPAETSGSSIVMLVLYSSCNPESNVALIRDRRRIKSFHCSFHNDKPALRDRNTGKRGRESVKLREKITCEPDQNKSREWL